MAVRQCVNCFPNYPNIPNVPNCNGGCDMSSRVVYPTIVCADPNCDRLVKSEKKEIDRYFNSDSPVKDPPATQEMIDRIEKKLIAEDPTNPLRGILRDIGHYVNGTWTITRYRIRWAAIRKHDPATFNNWPEKTKKERKDRLGEKAWTFGTIVRSHILYLVNCYEEEKRDGNEGRFIHVNTGSHGNENGRTIVNSIDLLKLFKGDQGRVDKYVKESVNFIKEELDGLKMKKRVSVFLINSLSVPIYPEDKDIVDAWCMSRQLQDERYLLYTESRRIAQTLRADVIDMEHV